MAKLIATYSGSNQTIEASRSVPITIRVGTVSGPFRIDYGDLCGDGSAKITYRPGDVDDVVVDVDILPGVLLEFAKRVIKDLGEDRKSVV